MCNFNNQSDEVKAFMHLFMKKAATSIGGENFLLSLIESIKTKRPYPLMHKEMQVSSNNTTIKWNKLVFKDKVELIQDILIKHKSSENSDFNILNVQNAKKKKNIINMVRTIAPLEFIISPQNHNDGSGFSFKAFEKMENEDVRFNPIFIAMFFCSIEFTKKALKYNAELK